MNYILPLATLLAFSVATQAQQPTYHATIDADADPALAVLPGGVLLAVPGLADDFEIAGGGQFVELPNGDARLTGRVRSRSSLFSAFLVDLQFSQRIVPGAANYPPSGSPSLGLLASAYVPVGAIDPATFHYFAQVDGRLYGTHAYDGAIVDVQLVGNAAQLGVGANDRNGEYGLLAELALTVVQPAAGPFGPLTTATLTCDLPVSRTDAAAHPEVDSTRSALAFGRAIELPGIADDYVFVPAGTFVERPDGTAALSGRLVRLPQLDDGWDLALALSNRTDPGMPNHPPAGSPVLGMLPGAYVGGGGVIDPAAWRYYEVATATLTGIGINDGGLLMLANAGAVQVGGGANQTNAFHGGAGTFTVTVAAQPSARTLNPTGDAELTFLASRYPVLPLPVLTPPAQPYTLPTLTDQGVTLEGDNLAWIELVAIGADLAGRGSEANWLSGWFRVLDNQHLELHARPGRAPGVYDLRALNAAVASNLEHLTLAAPTQPTLVAEHEAPGGSFLHLHVHQGAATAALTSAIAWSFSSQPTVIPGFVTLGLGNNGIGLRVIPALLPNDPVTGIARYDLGPIPGGFSGYSFFFQAITVDLANFVTPLSTTNVWSVPL